MRLLNFGSLNIDYVYRVDNFLKPGETKAALFRTVFAGGKGLNQSIALARAGLKPCHAGKVGVEGRFLVEKLASEGVDVGRIEVSFEAATGHTVIQVDDAGRNCILLFGGANREIDGAYIGRALEGFGEGDFLLIQNELSSTAEIIEAAWLRGMTIAMNPSPCDAAVAAYPLDRIGIFLLNELEAADLSGISEPQEAALALSKRYQKAIVVVTLGPEGSLCVQDGKVTRQRAYPVKAVDTTAAGDTFTGYFLAGLLEGRPLPETLDLAARAASICVTRPGASDSVPWRAELAV
ncbi:MAG: ribokinase [Spirochaetes bacterium]|nr:ribokinase [Spirochaetota bacterium]